jgi:hypothetical protein
MATVLPEEPQRSGSSRWIERERGEMGTAVEEHGNFDFF